MSQLIEKIGSTALVALLLLSLIAFTPTIYASPIWLFLDVYTACPGTEVTAYGEADKSEILVKIYWSLDTTLEPEIDTLLARVRAEKEPPYAYETTFIVPTEPQGDYYVFAWNDVDADGVVDVGEFDMVEFTIIIGITVSPNWGPIYCGVVASGVGARAGATVKIYWSEDDLLDPDVDLLLGEVVAEADGTFSLTFEVPDTAVLGTFYYVFAWDDLDDNGVVEVDEYAYVDFFASIVSKPEYQRTETVSILGAGYTPGEEVEVNILYLGESVLGYPKTLVADAEGYVRDEWKILKNADVGT
jgi:hypothetical protein